MLTALFWLGKLPNHPEFLSSKTEAHLEAVLTAWIAHGQNHIGVSLINAPNAKALYGYVFLLNSVRSPLLKTPYIGLLLTSHDSKDRPYPFILAQDTATTPDEFISQIKAFCLQHRANFTQFYQNFNAQRFYEQLHEAYTTLQTLHTHHPSHKDYWIAFYPTVGSITLSTEHLSPTLYRKLMRRDD